MRSSISGLVVWVVGLAACSSRPANDYELGDGVLAKVNLAATRQRIDGFGASSAWTTPRISDEQATLFYDVEQGIGLSYLRLRITPAGTTDELVTAQKATALGVKVWAAPWSPPAEWKTNNSVIQGGQLLPEHWQDWADRLTAFVKSMADEGVPLVALSAQNEPHYADKWETCDWSATDLASFVRDHLGPTLRREGLTLPIVAPETQNWEIFGEFANALVADPITAAFIGPLATHAYGNASAHALPAAAGHAIWMSEVSAEGDPDPKMDSGLWTAATIHDSLVNGNVSVFHWWWLNPSDPKSNGALIIEGELARRGWVLGNWSRFVRPGFNRVDARALPQPGVNVSAFADPESGRVVIVAINTTMMELPQQFAIRGGTVPSTFTPWVTSDELALAPQDPVAAIDGAFWYTLPARSVTSFVSN
jgi:glucuronoarabinoxylan endo-1,4-beta-xylanase